MRRKPCKRGKHDDVRTSNSPTKQRIVCRRCGRVAYLSRLPRGQR